MAEEDSCSAIAVAYAAFRALADANCMMFAAVSVDRGIDSVVVAAETVVLALVANADWALAVIVGQASVVIVDPALAATVDQALEATFGQASVASVVEAIDAAQAMVDQPNAFVAVNYDVGLDQKMIVVVVIGAIAMETMLVAADSSGHSDLLNAIQVLQIYERERELLVRILCHVLLTQG